MYQKAAIRNSYCVLYVCVTIKFLLCFVCLWVNQILTVFCMFVWQIVLIWVQSNSLPWKTCVLESLSNDKGCEFSRFIQDLVFENSLKGPIQHLLVQSQQRKQHNNEPSMFKVKNQQKRKMLQGKKVYNVYPLLTLHKRLFVSLKCFCP